MLLGVGLSRGTLGDVNIKPFRARRETRVLGRKQPAEAALSRLQYCPSPLFSAGSLFRQEPLLEAGSSGSLRMPLSAALSTLAQFGSRKSTSSTGGFSPKRVAFFRSEEGRNLDVPLDSRQMHIA